MPTAGIKPLMDNQMQLLSGVRLQGIDLAVTPA
jgi:hypothetical protein